MSQLILSGGTVVDPRDGTMLPATDVLVVDGTIREVRAGLAEAAGPDISVIDAHGRFIVPGYNDMHAHAMGTSDVASTLELMMAYGITGFRQMAGSTGLLKQRASGGLRLPAAAPALLSTCGMLMHPGNASTSERAVAEVREQHAAGADFIKIGMVTREVFFDLQAEALRLGIPVAGHLPAGIDVEKASSLGMQSIEHLGPGVALFACCCADGEQIRQAAAARPGPKLPAVKLPFQDWILGKVLAKLVVNPINMAKPEDTALLARALANFDANLAEPLAERFAKDGTWQVPTLIRIKTQELCDSPAFAEDHDLRYMSEKTRRTWQNAAAKFGRFSADARATYSHAYELQLRLTKLLDEAGVKMLTGTDSSGAAWVVPGAALHREFDEFALAGLSPLAILRMATWSAAEFLNATSTMGTVTPGKNADLVLLEADPTASVDHLHRIAGVVRGGTHYGPAELAAIKDRIAAGRLVP